VIDLGVGDVTPATAAGGGERHPRGADDMARPETFKGYGPYVGYEWLRRRDRRPGFGTRAA